MNSKLDLDNKTKAHAQASRKVMDIQHDNGVDVSVTFNPGIKRRT